MRNVSCHFLRTLRCGITSPSVLKISLKEIEIELAIWQTISFSANPNIKTIKAKLVSQVHHFKTKKKKCNEYEERISYITRLLNKIHRKLIRSCVLGMCITSKIVRLISLPAPHINAKTQEKSSKQWKCFTSNSLSFNREDFHH